MHETFELTWSLVLGLLPYALKLKPYTIIRMPCAVRLFLFSDFRIPTSEFLKSYFNLFNQDPLANHFSFSSSRIPLPSMLFSVLRVQFISSGSLAGIAMPIGS